MEEEEAAAAPSLPWPSEAEAEEAAAAAASVKWPSDGLLSEDWIASFARALDDSSRSAGILSSLLPVPVLDSLLSSASKILHHEPNCLRISVDGILPSCSVVLVGDLHGQFHDLLRLLDLAGPPSPTRIFVFNGDYVDRGAWGLETFLLLLSWKIFLPERVFLLRGNHETRFCTSAYGFEQELVAKYGEVAKHLYRRCLGCFEGLPMAAVIADCVFMAHGGLFRHMDSPQRKPKRKVRGRGRRAARQDPESKSITLGSLDDLDTARRSFLDPSGQGHSTILADVLWSDPSLESGLASNSARGIGLLWGPDCTEDFLVKNRLKLIVRSHEGPDARAKRPEMKDMSKGCTIDHVVNSGKLITLFSAPDYPQFQAGAHRYNNEGAYIVLQGLDFSCPQIFTFSAVLPRPKATAYYDYENAMDSDDQLDMGASSDDSTSSDVR